MSTNAVAPKAATPLGSLQGLLEKYKSQIAVALPKHMTPERMIRVALTAVSQSWKLMQCDPLTVCGSIVQASILGLEPNSLLGEAFLIPYKNNKRTDPVTRKRGVYECQLQVGYKGQIKLARNSREIAMIDAQLVYEKDDFEFEKGEHPFLRHKWPKTGERGTLIGCWAGFRTRDGAFNFEYMTAEEIIAHRDKYSKSIDFDTKEIYGPWVDSPEWMWKKTPLLKVLKLAPKSIEVQQAVSLTEQSEAGIRQTFSIDVPFELQPPPEDDEQKQIEGDMPQRKSDQAKKELEAAAVEGQKPAGHGMTKVGEMLPGIGKDPIA